MCLSVCVSVCLSVCLSKTQPIIALPYYLSGPAAGVRCCCEASAAAAAAGPGFPQQQSYGKKEKNRDPNRTVRIVPVESRPKWLMFC